MQSFLPGVGTADSSAFTHTLPSQNNCQRYEHTGKGTLTVEETTICEDRGGVVRHSLHT